LIIYPERIVPDNTPVGIVAIHLKRYEFAEAYLDGKRVLDVACGVGYGARYLADEGNHVIGVDIDGAAIAYAQQRYGGHRNTNFVLSDGMQLGLRSSQFDAVCSFETIEHVLDVDVFLNEVRRVLKPLGVFIVSTPRVARSDLRPVNPHHHQEWNPTDFEQLLRAHFKNVEVFGQFRRETSTALWLKRLDVLRLRTWLLPNWLIRRAAQASGVRAMADLHLEDVLIRRGDLRHASEIVAVASDEN
jgi:2-polyprenyl-3-methyl-5-hydroxy-6-metoxy-1,4-benzoquinol methylase